MARTQKNEFSILIVDDEPLIRESLFEILWLEGYSVCKAASAEEALLILKSSPMDIVITDYKLPKINGLQLLSLLKKDYPKIEVILLTGYATIATAVEAIKNGAFDYLTKPINDSEFKLSIDKIIEKKKILEENAELKKILAKDRRASLDQLIGSSEKMQKVYRMVDAVASANATILISGESGTGKGLLARAIHQADPGRRDKPFVEVSCGALTETLLESELFGHVKGSFTSAIRDKEGRFEYAQGGTIFLDEIDAFTPNLQVKLLRVLQDGFYERVGDNAARKADARIIVATNQDLPKLVANGKFREDLYYRVNVIQINMPPLRERKTDIDALAVHFLTHYNKINQKNLKGLSATTRELFQRYNWPGNIRELENAIEGAVIMAQGIMVEPEDIPNLVKFQELENDFYSPHKASPNGTLAPLKKAVEAPEREHIIAVLKKCNGKRTQAAVELGINRTTLYNKLKKYKIHSV
ncbi:MAG: sigma-54-dependent Fis family transcriptional regulator [Candidatus Omnitrophica bacterium]|nr:sigma-54-dependent Fis family transcriptional regulator [Candidatus Omnitrophota bacterium]